MTAQYIEYRKLSLGNRFNILALHLDTYSDIAGMLLVLPKTEFVLVVPAGALVRADILEEFDKAIASRPDAAIFYAEEMVSQAESGINKHHCKPEFNLPMLVAVDFIGFPVAIRTKVLNELLSIRPGKFPLTLYTLLVRAALRGIKFKRIPSFLVTANIAHPRLSVPARLQILNEEFNSSSSRYDFTPGLVEGTIRMRKVFKSHPPITIIVPTNRSQGKGTGLRPLILNMLDSLAESTWPPDKIEVLIGDDRGVGGIYDSHSWPFRLNLVDTRREHTSFNYARKMNDLWRMSSTENLILMNDDIVINSKDFIESLLTFSTDDDVGGCGACLLFPNGNYQHAGMIGGIFEVFAHPWYNKPTNVATYGDWAMIHREYSAVTGAVFATRRSILEKINGFDEFFSLDFNDVDMCLRMKLLGYRIVYTPFANLTHHETASRVGLFAPGDQVLTFLNKWRDVIKCDPMYSPNLSRNRDDVVCHLDT
jgi:Glycosyltransferase like family 2